jgi:hypothetical protein
MKTRHAILFSFVVLALISSVIPANAILIYSNDFQTGAGSEWSSKQISTTPKGGRSFLGEFGNRYNADGSLSSHDIVNLSLGALPVHNRATLSFDLFLMRSWDGEAQNYSHDGDSNGSYFGKDYFNVLANGSTLLHETFSNGNTAGQSFGNGDSMSGSVEHYTLGYDFVYWDTAQEKNVTCPNLDSVYHFDLSFMDSSSNLALSFFGDKSMQDILDESWGLDNVRVSVTPVPEPSTTLLVVIGGASMLAFRRYVRRS